MDRIFRLLLAVALMAPVTGYAQPCDCKQYTGVILLYPRSLRQEDLGRLAYLADSLQKEYAYVFTIVPPDPDWASVLERMHARPVVPRLTRHGVTEPYGIIRAGKGNRIAVLDLGAWNDTTVKRASRYNWLGKEYPVFIGFGNIPLEGAKVLSQAVPGFQEIMGATVAEGKDSTLFLGQAMVPVSLAGKPGIGKTTLVLNQGVIMERRDATVPLDSVPREYMLKRKQPGSQ